LSIIYIHAHISFWLINFYLWLVLVFLFIRVYYGFTPLQHQTSRHHRITKILFVTWWCQIRIGRNFMKEHSQVLQLLALIYCPMVTWLFWIRPCVTIRKVGSINFLKTQMWTCQPWKRLLFRKCLQCAPTVESKIWPTF